MHRLSAPFVALTTAPKWAPKVSRARRYNFPSEPRPAAAAAAAAAAASVAGPIIVRAQLCAPNLCDAHALLGAGAGAKTPARRSLPVGSERAQTRPHPIKQNVSLPLPTGTGRARARRLVYLAPIGLLARELAALALAAGRVGRRAGRNNKPESGRARAHARRSHGALMDSATRRRAQ